jgi:caffeoyl-CoA O-methyltransferase
MECVTSLRTSVAVTAMIFPFLGVLAAQPPENAGESFRKQYLETFPWTLSNATAGDAMLLRILVESRRAKNGVEVGTNTGYGAISMGIAFERTGGRLTTIEMDPRMAAAARSHLTNVGLGEVVTVVEGDALIELAALQGTYDFVFIDAAKPDYLRYLKALEPKLEPGAVVVADNVIDYAPQMPDFLEYIQSSPLYDTQIVRASMQKNDGMSVSYKVR